MICELPVHTGWLLSLARLETEEDGLKSDRRHQGTSLARLRTEQGGLKSNRTHQGFSLVSLVTSESRESRITVG